MLMEISPRVLERRIREKLESLGYKTYDISSRDGFTIFMLETNNKRIIIWIRKAPLTSKAIKLFNKIINKYEYDKTIILRIDNKADYTRKTEKYSIEYIGSIDSKEIIKRIQKHIF